MRVEPARTSSRIVTIRCQSRVPNTDAVAPHASRLRAGLAPLLDNVIDTMDNLERRQRGRTVA